MEKIEVTRPKLIILLGEIIEKVMERNAVYQDAWQRQGICGVLTRLSDKLIRISNWYGQEVIIQGEDTNNDFIDAIGYSLLGLLYLEERGRLPTPAEIVDEYAKARAAYESEKLFLEVDSAIMKTTQSEAVHVNLREMDWHSQFGCGCEHCQQMAKEFAKRELENKTKEE